MKWNKINSEKDLPEMDDNNNSDDVMGTLEYKGKRYSMPVYIEDGEWHYVDSQKKISETEFKVIAWQPYPNYFNK